MPLLTMLTLLMKHYEAIEDKEALHTTLTAIVASIRTIQPCQGVIATLNVALFAGQQGLAEKAQAWMEEAIQTVETVEREKEKCHTAVLRALLRVSLPKEVVSSYAERVVESDKKESNLSLRNALLCQCAMMYALKTSSVRRWESV